MKFTDGDRVEWTGPAPEAEDDHGIPLPGEQGTIVSFDPPGEWVVRWDRAGIAVYAEEYLRKIETGSDT